MAVFYWFMDNILHDRVHLVSHAKYRIFGTEVSAAKFPPSTVQLNIARACTLEAPILKRQAQTLTINTDELCEGAHTSLTPTQPTLLEINMETQKGPHKDYSSSKMGLYGFPC